LRIEIDREADGRWLAEVPDLPGVMAYGADRPTAIASVKALARRVLADRIEHGEEVPALREVFAVPASAVL
jgi:predicted RNase H-like HicB family nuclease